MYQLEEYRVQPASARFFRPATTARPVVIWEGRAVMTGFGRM
jgi:hypothetical protein